MSIAEAHPDPLDLEDFRRIGHQVVDWITDYLAALPEGPVFQPVPPALAERFRSTPAPRAGTDADAVFAEFRDSIGPYPFGNGHPRFWGWVNSPPLPIGILAEVLAAAMDPSCAGGNHAAVWVEHQVLDWFKELLGFPAESHGLLVSGGSMASLTALAVARHVHCGFDVRRQGLQAGTPRLESRARTSSGADAARAGARSAAETTAAEPTRENREMKTGPARERRVTPMAVVHL